MWCRAGVGRLVAEMLDRNRSEDIHAIPIATAHSEPFDGVFLRYVSDFHHVMASAKALGFGVGEIGKPAAVLGVNTGRL